jgi:ATP-binding cassette subfamily B protein
LTATELRLGRGELRRLAQRTPAILVLADGKAALLDKVSETDNVCCALIEDPQSPQQLSVLVDEPRLFDHWSGEALVFRRSWSLGDDKRPFGMWWFIGQLVREKKSVRDIAIAAFILGFLALLPPLTFIILLDRVLTNRSFSTLWVMGAAMMIATMFDSAFGFLRRKMVYLVAARIDARINLHVFDRLLDLPMAFFERIPTGMISSKIGQIWHIRHFLTGQVLGTLVDSIALLILLPVLFLINWKLSIMVVALAAAILGVYLLYLPKLRVKHQAVVAAEQALSAHQVETIYGIRTVKSLSLEGLKRHQRDLRVAKTMQTHMDFDRLANYPQTLVTPLERFIYSGSIFIGCYMALSDTTGSSMGRVVAFTMLAGRVAAPIEQ